MDDLQDVPLLHQGGVLGQQVDDHARQRFRPGGRQGLEGDAGQRLVLDADAGDGRPLAVRQPVAPPEADVGVGPAALYKGERVVVGLQQGLALGVGVEEDVPLLAQGGVLGQQVDDDAILARRLQPAASLDGEGLQEEAVAGGGVARPDLEAEAQAGRFVEADDMVEPVVAQRVGGRPGDVAAADDEAHLGMIGLVGRHGFVAEVVAPVGEVGQGEVVFAGVEGHAGGEAGTVGPRAVEVVGPAVVAQDVGADGDDVAVGDERAFGADGGGVGVVNVYGDVPAGGVLHQPLPGQRLGHGGEGKLGHIVR